MVIRGVQLPEDPLLGRTHYTVGLIEGGVAPNVDFAARVGGAAVPDRRRAGAVRDALACRRRPRVGRARARYSGRAHAHRARLRARAVFPYTTDVPLLDALGNAAAAAGPGSIHVAHTDEEHVAIDELRAAVSLYETLAARLLRS